MTINVFQDIQTLVQVRMICNAMLFNIDRMVSEGETKTNAEDRAETLFVGLRDQVNQMPYEFNYTFGGQANGTDEINAFITALDTLIKNMRDFTYKSERV